MLIEDEKLALGKVESSLQTVDERYQVGVPWRSDRPELPNNRQMAQSRLVSTEMKSLKFEKRPAKLPESRISPSQGENDRVVLATNAQEKEDNSRTLEDEEWRLDPKRFSSWSWYIRVLARVRRALYNMRNGDQRRTDAELTIDELQEAEEEAIRLAQQEGFRGDYDIVKSGKPVPKTSPLVKVNPIIDEADLIRSDGRLKFAEQLSYDVRHPVILPRRHWITRLIVKDYHEKANHNAGVNFILSQINEKYWIIAAREEIREWENQCNHRKRRRSKPAIQIMAPLPKVRLRFTYRAFHQCGIDFAGPFFTIQGRGQFSPESEISKEFHPRKRWRKVQHLVYLVWRRWLKECLLLLTVRQEVVGNSQRFKCG